MRLEKQDRLQFLNAVIADERLQLGLADLLQQVLLRSIPYRELPVGVVLAALLAVDLLLNLVRSERGQQVVAGDLPILVAQVDVHVLSLPLLGPHLS